MDHKSHLFPGSAGDPPSGPIAWMTKRAVAANLLMLVFVIGGLAVAWNIKKEVFADYDLDTVTVTKSYPGASPEEVERGIILAVEDSIQGLDNIKKISATASEGSARITVEVINGKKIQATAQEIKNAVDRISSFPEDAEETRVTVTQRQWYVISLALFGNQSEHVLREAAEMVRDRLLQNPGITQVEFSGVRDYEITVSVSQDTLRTYGLTLGEIAAIIRRTAVEVPGGSIKTRGGDVLVRMTERRDFGREFENIPIITANDGTQVLLGDIAEVVDGFEDSNYFAAYNGKQAVLIDVYRIGTQTPLSVSAAVREMLDDIRSGLPPGIDVAARNDRSDMYRQRMDLLLKNGYSGLILVFLLLSLFLEPRLAFWVSMGIPVSVLGAMIFLPLTHVTINTMSMFGFIISLGIVVDDAIVAGESMYHHRQTGKPWLRAAIDGTRTVAIPVIFSVLTSIVAFLPLFFVSGTIGKMFQQIPVVVIAVFSVSLIETLFILPAHIGHHTSRAESFLFKWIRRRQEQFSDRFTWMVHTGYGPLLKRLLRQRYIVISLGAALLTVSISYIQSGRMGFELFPRIESDVALVTAELPYGSAMEKAREIQKVLVDAAREVVAENGGNSLSEGIFSSIYKNKVSVRVYLTPPDVRPVSTSRLSRLWRERVGPLIGMESLKFESDSGGPGGGATLSVELTHRRIDVLAQASADLAERLRFFQNVADVDDGYSPGKRQLDFRIRPEARSLGLTPQDVAQQVRHAYYGAEALRQQRGRNEIKVMVRFPESERISEFHLEEMSLRTPSGKEIPLLDAVDITQGRAYTSISRRDGRRIVTVTADVNPPRQADWVLNTMVSDILPVLQKKYPGLSYSFEGRQADRRESMQSLVRGLAVALLVIYAMLAVPFNSFVQPMIIMVSIPFGIVGTVVGHLLMGYSLSVMSMFGVVALSGVVINGSLVLIDLANQKRLGGENAYDAIWHAGIHRFRPIILTALTTFGGLAPMIFETSRQARFLIPMALSLGFGSLFATAITLILVPSLYMVVEDIRKWFGFSDSRAIPPSETSS